MRTSEFKNLFIAIDDNIRKEFQDNPISEDDAYDMFILELDKCELGLTNEVEEGIFQEYVEYSELFIVQGIEMRYEVYEVGFLKWATDDYQSAMDSALACFEYSYIVDTVTGERVDIGGPVSGQVGEGAASEMGRLFYPDRITHRLGE